MIALLFYKYYNPSNSVIILLLVSYSTFKFDIYINNKIFLSNAWCLNYSKSFQPFLKKNICVISLLNCYFSKIENLIKLNLRVMGFEFINMKIYRFLCFVKEVIKRQIYNSIFTLYYVQFIGKGLMFMFGKCSIITVWLQPHSTIFTW